jgi:hypothetical protein
MPTRCGVCILTTSHCETALLALRKALLIGPDRASCFSDTDRRFDLNVTLSRYFDRWPIKQIPLSAKQMLGAARMFELDKESRVRLPVLWLLAGSVLSYVAAPTGFVDVCALLTCGQLRRMLSGLDLSGLCSAAGHIQKKRARRGTCPSRSSVIGVKNRSQTLLTRANRRHNPTLAEIRVYPTNRFSSLAFSAQVNWLPAKTRLYAPRTARFQDLAVCRKKTCLRESCGIRAVFGPKSSVGEANLPPKTRATAILRFSPTNC